jgi:hypothetical protein
MDISAPFSQILCTLVRIINIERRCGNIRVMVLRILPNGSSQSCPNNSGSHRSAGSHGIKHNGRG